MIQADLQRLIKRVRKMDPEHTIPPLRNLPPVDGKVFLRRQVLKRLLALRTEALRLYRPLPHLAAFHASTARWRIIDGSNRSSKTLSCGVEFSRAFCGCDPYDKYPPRGGNALVIGLDLDQVVMLWRKIGEPGAFKIIPDEQTGLLRAVRPDPNNPLRLDPYDDAYRELWRDAPPLIPPRMIQGRVAWEDYGKRVPRYVRSVTGAQALFRSADGKPPQGGHYNWAWVDEQIDKDDFIAELIRGLVALDEPPQWLPKAFWSATAQVTNPTLTDFRRQAEQGSQQFASFQATIDDNPYVIAEEKQVFWDTLPEDERATRYHGIPAIAGRRCYPNFDPQGIHGYEPKPIPADWCRYLWVDPGTRLCATLLLAVDPEEKHVWVYDGFDGRVEDARDWGRQVCDRLGGHQLQAAGIDRRAGRQNSFSAGMNTAQRYWEALQGAGVKPQQVGPLNGFLPGSDDVQAREEALRSWLAIRRTGPFKDLPKLLIARGVLPKLERQIRNACVDVSRKTGKETRQKDHAKDYLDDLEYAAQYGANYYQPESPQQRPEATVWDHFCRYQRHHRQRESSRRPRGFGHVLEIG